MRGPGRHIGLCGVEMGGEVARRKVVRSIQGCGVWSGGGLGLFEMFGCLVVTS